MAEIGFEATGKQKGSFPFDSTDRVFNTLADVELYYAVTDRYERMPVKVWKDQSDHAKGIHHYYWDGSSFEKEIHILVLSKILGKLEMGMTLPTLQDANDNEYVQNEDRLILKESVAGANLTKAYIFLLTVLN